MAGSISLNIIDEAYFWNPDQPLVDDVLIQILDPNNPSVPLLQIRSAPGGVQIGGFEGAFTLTFTKPGWEMREIGVIFPDSGLEEQFIIMPRADTTYDLLVEPVEDGFTYSIDGNGVDMVVDDEIVDLSDVTALTNFTALVGSDGRNTFTGSDFDDTIRGEGGRDTLSGGLGNDQLEGGSGRNTLNGDEGEDTLIGGSRTDIINGGADNDTANGGSGRDTISGDDGDDVLNGEGGSDTLIDGDGIDTLTGGGGRDIFVFGTDDDAETITDYNDRQDTIWIEGLTFEELTITDTESGDVLIEWGNDSITLIDVNGRLDASDLQADDFFFDQTDLI